MKRPKMILFDYGQTLVNEAAFDGVKGTEAVLQYCTENKYHLTAEQIQQEANAINHELGRFDPSKRHLFQVEAPNYMFTSYLYESLGIKISLTSEQVDQVFWDAAAPGRPTEGVTAFLEYLVQKGIRTGVISNISFCGQVVEQRIRGLFPRHPFEFILATSEYLFRKPNKRIFWLALEKAGLGPGPQLLLGQDCKTGQDSGQSSEHSSRDVWYIGDQYECDIVGAAGAGLFPIWYTGAMDMPYIPHEGVLTVKNWEEVRAMLDKCEA
ncbi:MAG: HAD family hydrolase [Acetatifactor sp.]|nr:HAD family hydrolase [Acetatifactor sp.]